MKVKNWKTMPLSILVAIVWMFTVGHAAAQEFDQSHTLYDGILKAHVVNGVVDYVALKTKPRPLRRYLAKLALVHEAQFRSWTEPQQIAFLANLYNATTLQMIVDHYPVKSIKDIGSWRKGPWDQPVVKLFGKTITLNNLEHDILRKQYKEPRLHMALVCAAKGCPPLRSEAYTGEKLDKQLDDQSRTYLATPAGLVINRKKRTASISSILKWYGEDFTSVRGFVEKYSGQDLGGLKIKYIEYNWNLNE